MDAFTLIVPFYRNCRMLERQVQEWGQYPAAVSIIVVDDGSPEPARPIIEAAAVAELLARVRLYRILVDIPWNREGARNLAAQEAGTRWLVHVDIDHILPAASARALLDFTADERCWYRFPRWRVGGADETRRKDKIDAAVKFGEIHPHIDSYLMTRAMYWKCGGYDEDFAGVLGGGGDFLRRADKVAAVALLPRAIPLHVHTRHSVVDASDFSLSRDTAPGKVIARKKQALIRPHAGRRLRFAWRREL